MPRTVLLHLNVTVPDGDARNADEIENAVRSALEVGLDDESVENLDIEFVLTEEI